MYGVFKISKEAVNPSVGFGDIFSMLSNSENEDSLHKIELFIPEFFETEDVAIKAGKDKQAKHAKDMVKKYIRETIKYPNLNKPFDEIEEDTVIAAVNIIILEIPHVFGLGVKKSDIDIDKIKKEIEDESK